MDLVRTQQRQRLLYTVTLTSKGATLFEGAFENESVRRDGVVGFLLDNHSTVSQQTIDLVLAPFGGANADTALRRVVAIYRAAGVVVDIHLGSVVIDDGPTHLYSVFTDYSNGDHEIEHFPSAEERLAALRRRAHSLANMFAASDSSFESASESECLAGIQLALGRRPRIYLFDARRDDIGHHYQG